ncbi:MAG: MBL fold metallo-hydrolase [Candidatus Micrarchaeota archaeon]
METISLEDFKPLGKLDGFYYFDVDKRTCSTRYLIRDVKGKKTMMIDSGDGKDGLDFTPDPVFLTHGHYDHTGGVKPDWPDVRLHAAEDARLPFINIPTNAKRVDEKAILFGAHRFELHHTPGHTPGSACLFEKASGVLFSGDTKFADGGYGRTDLGGPGAEGQMAKSLEMLERVPWRTLCPGHGKIEWRN